MKNFINRCRMVTISRKVRETREVNGKLEEKLVSKELPVRVNAGTPFDHRMLK